MLFKSSAPSHSIISFLAMGIRNHSPLANKTILSQRRSASTFNCHSFLSIKQILAAARCNLRGEGRSMRAGVLAPLQHDVSSILYNLRSFWSWATRHEWRMLLGRQLLQSTHQLPCFLLRKGLLSPLSQLRTCLFAPSSLRDGP